MFLYFNASRKASKVAERSWLKLFKKLIPRKAFTIINFTLFERIISKSDKSDNFLIF